MREMLDLAFNVNFAEGFAFCDFENCARLAGEKSKPIFSLIEKMLSVVSLNELVCVAI